jgi:hypothetical protein
MAKFLLSKGADVNIKDKNERTPLHLGRWLQKNKIN